MGSVGTPDRYRAQCSNCMAVTQDPDTRQCPACGSRRLVVLTQPQPRTETGETAHPHRADVVGRKGGQKTQAKKRYTTRTRS